MSCADARRLASSGNLLFEAPPAKDDSVDANRGDRHDVEQADVDVSDVQLDVAAEQMNVRPKWNDGESNERRHHHDDRRGREHPLIGARRGDVFLEDQLDGIRDRLEHAVRSHAHRTQTHLHPRDDLALEQHHVGDPYECGR